MTEIVGGTWVGYWVAKHNGMVYDPAISSAIGLERNGETVAGIIYEDFNGKSIVCHMAIQGRITPEWLHAITDYAFHQCRVHKIIAPCYTDNVRAMRILPKMGFIEEGRLRDAQPNGDVVLFTMTREQCKYLGDRYAHRNGFIEPLDRGSGDSRRGLDHAAIGAWSGPEGICD